jgi:diaminopropionate ammonia-lyase
MSSNIFANPNKSAIKPLPPRNPEVRAFHTSLPHYTETPLVSLPEIAKGLGIGHLLLKDESFRLGLPAFKILGASWATSRAIIEKLHLIFDDVEPSESLQTLAIAAQAAGLTLYAATDGNHGRAVARMAKYLGVEAKIFVPRMLDKEAKSKIESEGAVVEVFEGDYDQTVLGTKLAAEKHEDGKGLLISDTALETGDEIPQWIVDGYQTMFDEIEEQVLEITGRHTITHVLAPVGVGSLAQAVVTHFRRLPRSDETQIITVEPITAACLKTSLEAGEMTSVNATNTICTGMCCGTVSAVAWPLLKAGVDVSVTVDDEKVHKAVLELQTYDVWAGPCGAASLAGLHHLIETGFAVTGPDTVAVILCTEGKRGY